MLKFIFDPSMYKRIALLKGNHQAFSITVEEAVQAAAVRQNILVECYLQEIYCGDQAPALFTDTSALLALYEQYCDLIDSVAQPLNENGLMSPVCKTFLCYRVSLQTMLVNHRIMSLEKGLKCMIFCLREFFYTRGRILTNTDADKLVDLVSRMMK